MLTMMGTVSVRLNPSIVIGAIYQNYHLYQTPQLPVYPPITGPDPLSHPPAVVENQACTRSPRERSRWWLTSTINLYESWLAHVQCPIHAKAGPSKRGWLQIFTFQSSLQRQFRENLRLWASSCKKTRISRQSMHTPSQFARDHITSTKDDWKLVMWPNESLFKFFHTRNRENDLYERQTVPMFQSSTHNKCRCGESSPLKSWISLTAQQ